MTTQGFVNVKRSLMLGRACRYNEHPNLFFHAMTQNVAPRVFLVALARYEEGRKPSTGHTHEYYRTPTS